MTDILDTRPDTTAATRSPLDDARSQLADAIKVLGYDQGMYDLLAAPRRELTVSIPLRRDDGSGGDHHRPPGAAQLLPRAGQGRPALQPARRPRRGPRAGDVDDVEVRAARRPVRRRQGWRGHRSARLLAGRAGARHPALHLGDHAADRSRARHPRARHRHRRADHGLDDGHLLGEHRAHRSGRRDRQADQPRRLARPCLVHLARRRARRPGGAHPPGHRSRRLRPRPCRASARLVAGRRGSSPRPASGSRPWPTSTAQSMRPAASTCPPLRPTSTRRARSSGSTAPSPIDAGDLLELDCRPAGTGGGRRRAARRQRRTCPRTPGRRGRQRPDDVGGRRHPRRQGRHRRARHPGQRRRRHRVVLRMGSGQPGVLVDRGPRSRPGWPIG